MEEKIIFWDTETTGLFDYKKDLADPSQPRIIQIAGVLSTKDEILEQFVAYIKPDGWDISAEITEINGITTHMCEEKGIPILEAIAGMEALAAKASLSVAHNMSFDMAMYNRETVPLGMERTKLRDLPRFCTMKRDDRFKNAKLEKSLGKLHLQLFGESHVNTHTALGDALATRKVYYHLMGMPHATQELKPLLF
jgi:DNA polymerase III epsilon subunit-like protein